MILKEEDSMWLYYQNINGIKANEFNICWQTAMRTMKDRQADIIGFSETNVDWNRWRTKQCKRTINQLWGGGGITTCTTDIEWEGTYKL